MALRVILGWLSMELRVKLYFFYRHRYWPNFSDPKTFSEKVNARKFDPKPLYSVLADKLAVRRYVEEVVGNDILIPLHWFVKDRDFVSLPELDFPAVCKTTHGSGPDNLEFLPSDKTPEELHAKFSKALRAQFRGVFFGEKHYASIPRGLIIESRLNPDGDVPSDYKFHVFSSGGKVSWFLQVDSDRFGDHRRDFFNERFESMSFSLLYPRSVVPPELPATIFEAKDFALKIGEGLGYARVDLYIVAGECFFGEVTLTPGSGFERFSDRSVDLKWGRLWQH